MSQKSLNPNHKPSESQKKVLVSHRRLSPSPEVRGKTHLNPVSWERLLPSPKSEKSLERVIERHKRLSPSLEARGKTQLSLVSR